MPPTPRTASLRQRVIYNEFDPFAAQWLRNLSAAGHINPGYVNAASIADLAPSDVGGATQAHFFAGIGAWSYALRLAGWPDDREVWTGSCPCQPFSVAGDGLGFDDPRHLWPTWFKLIRACRPGVVMGEQVASAAGLGWLDLVFSDMEGEGYTCWAADLGAACVGAPHVRQRIFWGAFRSGGLAHAEPRGLEGRGQRPAREAAALSPEHRWANCDWLSCRDGKHRPVEPCLEPLVDRAALGVGSLRAWSTWRNGTLRGYGNAIVPQVAAAFVRAFMDEIGYGGG
jgi:DNA (cytosine-5)-methyltransferase 1